MPDATDNLVACPSCDLIFDVGGLHHRQKANCSRCGHFLTLARDDAMERVLALSIAGLVFLAVGCSFPFLAFRASGMESVMTLPQTAVDLYRQGMPDLAFLVAAFIIVIPATVLVMVLVLSAALAAGREYRWLIPLARTVFHLQNWSMVEVFFIGVLVSLVKIAHMATVIVGISLWGYAGFALMFTLAVAGLDRYQCWRRLGMIAGPAHAH